MRTKHVLMTTAFAALFAACSNEDFLDNVQNVPSAKDAQRPTVDNVILNLVEEGAETRLGFGADGYVWEKDTIGALLMDDWNDTKLNGNRPSTVDKETWSDYAWAERYMLSDQIHTDYPFVRQNDGTWSCNAKMQEGNYFFAFPFQTYEGKREALHDLSEQVQNGVSDKSLSEAYAKNQFFVGYARIEAGTESDDVISANLKMTPVLGAVGITVKNVGTVPFTVNKIVLKTPDGVTDGFSTVIKLDPTDALYAGEDSSANPSYNIDTDESGWTDGKEFFNYANYEEMTFDGSAWNYNEKFTERYTKDGDLVNNTEKSVNYNRENALRAIVKPVKDTDHRVELTVNNSTVLKTAESARFIVMTNIYKYNNDDRNPNTITADIYTDRGMIKDVVISDVKGEVSEGAVTVISENPIVEIAPGKVNKVTLEIDNNSVQAPNAMNIFNEEDLLQFIEWNKEMRRPFTATLKNDITLTKEMAAILTKLDASGNREVHATLVVENDGKKLTIAKDAAANILDFVIVEGDVVVENALVLGSDSYVNGKFKGLVGSTMEWSISAQKIKIAEKASVRVASEIKNETSGNQQKKSLVIGENKGKFIIDANVAKLTISENRGEMEANADVTISAESKNMQNATLTVGANGILRCAGNLTNEGKQAGNEDEFAIIYNNGKIYNLVNKALGKVIVGKEQTIVTNVNSNAGIIDISANIKSDLNKKNAVIAYTVAKGASVTMKDIKAAGVTELTVDGGKVVSAKADGVVDAATVTKVIVTEKGGSIGIEEVGSKFSAAVVEVNGDVTLENLNIGGNKIEVKAGTTTIKGTVNAEASDIVLASYDNKKYVSHSATLNIATSADKLIAKSIAKTNDTKAGEAKVSNQGAVELEEEVGEGVAWSGNDASVDSGEEPNKKVTVKVNVKYNAGETGSSADVLTPGADNEEAEVTYIITDAAGWKTLNDLKDTDATDKVDYTYVIESIEIGALDVKAILDKEYTEGTATKKYIDDFKAVVAGKKVTLTGNLTNCDPSYGITMGELVLKGDALEVKSGSTTQNITFLTVSSVDYSKATNSLTIDGGYIKVNAQAQKGTSTYVTYNDALIINSGTKGEIVITDQSNGKDLLKWEFDNKVWGVM